MNSGFPRKEESGRVKKWQRDNTKYEDRDERAQWLCEVLCHPRASKNVARDSSGFLSHPMRAK
jgi:hypothetical protein